MMADNDAAGGSHAPSQRAKPFHAIVVRVGSARSVAAVLTLITSTIIFTVAGAATYGEFAVATAAGSVITAAAYQLFSKYALVTDSAKPLIRTFALTQLWLVPLVMIVVVAVMWDREPLLALAIGFWAVSQGFKEFLGELLRAASMLRAYSALYVADAAVTLGLTAMVSGSKSSAILLIVSAASSLLVVAVLLVRNYRRFHGGEPAPLRTVVTYALPVVIAGSANAGFIALVRRGINATAGAELGGTVNFLYDLLQKPYALFASSLSSAVVPFLRKSPHGRMVDSAAWLYVAAFLAMLVGVAVLTAGPIPRMPPFPPRDVAALTLAVVFLNRFRSGFVEIPYLLGSRTDRIAAGNVAAVGAAILLLPAAAGVMGTLMLAVICQIGAIVVALAILPAASEVTTATTRNAYRVLAVMLAGLLVLIGAPVTLLFTTAVTIMLLTLALLSVRSSLRKARFLRAEHGG